MADYKLPKGEIGWVDYLANGKVVYVVTSRQMRDIYYLYEVSDTGELKKVGRGKTPLELNEKYHIDQLVHKKMHTKH